MDDEELKKIVAEQVSASLKDSLDPLTKGIMTAVDEKLQAVTKSDPNDDKFTQLLEALAPKQEEKNALSALLENPDEPVTGASVANAVTEALNSHTKTVLAAIEDTKQHTAKQRREIAKNSSPLFRSIKDRKDWDQIKTQQVDPRFSMTIEEMMDRAEATGLPDEMENTADLIIESQELEMPTQTPRGRKGGSNVEDHIDDHDDERERLLAKQAELYKKAKQKVGAKSADRKEILEEIKRIDDQLNGDALGSVAA